MGRSWDTQAKTLRRLGQNCWPTEPRAQDRLTHTLFPHGSTCGQLATASTTRGAGVRNWSPGGEGGDDRTPAVTCLLISGAPVLLIAWCCALDTFFFLNACPSLLCLADILLRRLFFATLCQCNSMRSHAFSKVSQLETFNLV